MSWLDSVKFYKSGSEPKYEVGQKVYIPSQLYYGYNCTLLKTEAIEAEVVAVSKKKSGLIFKEFTYTIKEFKTGKEYKNIYESELKEKKLPTIADELANTNGYCSWIYSKWSYKSRDTALHKVGDQVYVTRQIPKKWEGTGITPTPPIYEVTGVSETACGGVINKEFLYTIKSLDTGKVRKSVYESELMSTSIPLGYYKVDDTHMDYERLDAAIPRTLDLEVEDSLYRDNVLELTYNAVADKVSLWFDPEFKNWNKLGLLFAERLWKRRADDERLYYFKRYVEPVMREGINHIPAEELWTADSIFTLLARFQAWELSSDDFKKDRMPSKKMRRLESDYSEE